MLHVPAASPPGKKPWHSLNTTLEGTRSRSEPFGEEKNIDYTRIQTPDRPAGSLVSKTTDLSQ